MASVLVQLAKKDERHDKNNESDKMIAEAKTFSGTTLRALTVKNRFVPPFLEAEMYLNFKNRSRQILWAIEHSCQSWGYCTDG